MANLAQSIDLLKPINLTPNFHRALCAASCVCVCVSRPKLTIGIGIGLGHWC